MSTERKWNDNWRKDLESHYNDVWTRLCECRNNKKDILIISKLMYVCNHFYFSMQECFDRTIEWICDWNSQYSLLKEGDYEKLLEEFMGGNYGEN